MSGGFLPERSRELGNQVPWNESELVTARRQKGKGRAVKPGPEVLRNLILGTWRPFRGKSGTGQLRRTTMSLST